LSRALAGWALVLATTGCGRINFDEGGPLVCPPGYAASGAGCYRDYYSEVPTEGKAFIDAELACEADGPGIHLAVISDAAEAQAIVAATDPGNTDFWIGTTELEQPGTFLDVTGMPAAYLAWAPSEPDGGVSYCVFMSRDLSVADHDCAQLDDYVCEYDGVAAIPATWGQ
jgi:hypothetical protein